MPGDDTTTQVATASNPAETDAAQAGQVLVTQETAAGASGEATPAVDLGAELAKVQAELAQERTAKAAAEKRAQESDNLVRTQAGAQSATDRRLNALAQELRRTRELVKAGLTDPAEIPKVEEAHRTQDDQDFASFTRDQGFVNTAALRAAGFSEVSDLGNEELADGLALWRVAARVGDREGIEQASISLARGIKRMQAARPTAPSSAPVAQTPAANGAARRVPNMDTGAGGAASESKQALVNRVANPEYDATPAELALVQKYRDEEGIYPKVKR